MAFGEAADWPPTLLSSPPSTSGTIDGASLSLFGDSPGSTRFAVMTGSKPHKSLTIPDTKALGQALIDVADAYPTRFLTETDFYPLVVAYLRGRVPALKTEAIVVGGSVDFRVGGPNPALLELAVAPRELRDGRQDNLKFPGHSKAPQLHASQNKTELKKLRTVPQSQAKNRYLLLLDFRGTLDVKKLKASYAATAAKMAPSRNAIRVVYVSRDRACDFAI